MNAKPRWPTLRPSHLLQALARAAILAFLTPICLAELAVLSMFSPASHRPLALASALVRWARRSVRLLGIKLEVNGDPPPPGLLVCNHTGYVDALVLASVCPMVFVAKTEAGNWPVFGAIVRGFGSLMIDRSKRTDIVRVGSGFRSVVESGATVCVFAEGTSTDGSTVLPFKSGLLEPAVKQGWPVTAAWVGYELPDGLPDRSVCYYGDSVFLPHFMRVLTRNSIRAHVAFAPPHGKVARGRVALSEALRNEVLALAKTRRNRSDLQGTAVGGPSIRESITSGTKPASPR
jgi:1-acyl-sn-glycerol-3-phosphate acyltransferase